MEVFAGTRIEKRFWGKSQLADELGISSCTLWRYRKRCMQKLEILPNFNPRAKMMSPREVEIVLVSLGYVY